MKNPVNSYFSSCSWSAIAIVSGAMLSAFGCGGSSDFVEDELGSTFSAVTSGHVTTQIKTCAWTAASRTPETTCTVDSGFVMIGGGAEIKGEVAGAVLRASAPAQDSDFAWVARSVGLAGTTHQLRAYVIGLQLEGYSTDALVSAVDIRNDSGDHSHGNNIYEQAFLSGGAIALPTTDTSSSMKWSYPESAIGWTSSFKYGHASVQNKTYAPVIRRCPADWAFGCLTSRVKSVVTPTGTNFQTATYTTPSPWLTTGVGLSQTSSTDRRYVADLIPLNGTQQGFTVRTQNVGGSDSATTRGYAVELTASGAIWEYTAIKFLSNGEVLSSSGQNEGAFLRESQVREGANAKWYLQAIRPGVFYLRNALPLAGGNCAYAAERSYIRVSTVCSGGSAEWAIDTVSEDAFLTHFRLRSLARGTCIDNNNMTGADSNLFLLPCVDSPTQNMSLDTPNTLP